jgi:tetratricopeptide (TPR) repeat protein
MDLSIITDNWAHDEDNEAANVRKVMGVDGRMKVQVRIRNGLIQWEAEGRPDGKRPYGQDTVLDYSRGLIAEGRSGSDVLSPDLLEELVLELFDFYKRSQALFHIGDYDRALSDVAHALAILGIVRKYAPEDSFQFDQYRPGLLVDRARAEMLREVRRGHVREALDALNRGIGAVEEFYLEHELDEQVADSTERQVLIELRRSLREKHNIPLDDHELLESLRVEQQVAIRKEDYEMAARLRDKINSLQERISRRT